MYYHHYLQHCAKVLQTIIVEYCAFFFRNTPPIYGAFYRHVRAINRRDLGHFLQCFVLAIHRSIDILSQRNIVERVVYHHHTKM